MLSDTSVSVVNNKQAKSVLYLVGLKQPFHDQDQTEYASHRLSLAVAGKAEVQPGHMQSDTTSDLLFLLQLGCLVRLYLAAVQKLENI